MWCSVCPNSSDIAVTRMYASHAANWQHYNANDVAVGPMCLAHYETWLTMYGYSSLAECIKQHTTSEVFASCFATVHAIRLGKANPNFVLGSCTSRTEGSTAVFRRARCMTRVAYDRRFGFELDVVGLKLAELEDELGDRHMAYLVDDDDEPES